MARGYVIGTLLTNNGICLAGIVATVIGLQASVGTCVCKALVAIHTNSTPTQPAAEYPVLSGVG